jgi:hypothetical protein
LAACGCQQCVEVQLQGWLEGDGHASLAAGGRQHTVKPQGQRYIRCKPEHSCQGIAEQAWAPCQQACACSCGQHSSSMPAAQEHAYAPTLAAGLTVSISCSRSSTPPAAASTHSRPWLSITARASELLDSQASEQMRQAPACSRPARAQQQRQITRKVGKRETTEHC